MRESWRTKLKRRPIKKSYRHRSNVPKHHTSKSAKPSRSRKIKK